MVANANSSATSGIPPAQNAGQGGLSAFSLISAAIVLDLLLISLLTWTLARAAGIPLWPIDQPVSGLLLLLPLALVIGVWAALGLSLRHAHSFASHLARTAVGATAALLFAFAVYFGFAGELAPDAVSIAITALIGLCALHANYIGVLRSLARAGVFSMPRARDRE